MATFFAAPIAACAFYRTGNGEPHGLQLRIETNARTFATVQIPARTGHGTQQGQRLSAPALRITPRSLNFETGA